jgi:DNA-directed RNA polymerase subunit M/transcription elongation factor TFIIS
MRPMDQHNPENRVKYTEDDSLSCPYCGNGYMHHKDVVIYNREKEDSNQGLAVQVTPEAVTTSDDLSGNPSARRNGVIIHFECENCSNRYELALHQHKGVTYLHWVR